MEQLSEEDIKWIEEHEDLVKQGRNVVNEASNEALEYVKLALENINDKQWRKMMMSRQAVEMGVGVALMEHLAPAIYKDMEKTMHKKLKIDKRIAVALRHIYIARVIKNIKEALDGRVK